MVLDWGNLYVKGTVGALKILKEFQDLIKSKTCNLSLAHDLRFATYRFDIILISVPTSNKLNLHVSYQSSTWKHWWALCYQDDKKLRLNKFNPCKAEFVTNLIM